MDIECFEPLGAFYISNISRFGMTSNDFLNAFTRAKSGYYSGVPLANVAKVMSASVMQPLLKRLKGYGPEAFIQTL